MKHTSDVRSPLLRWAKLLGGALLTLSVLVPLQASPASAANPFGQEFVSRHSGKCLDLTGLNSTNGTYIQQWSCLGNTNQAWIDGDSQNDGRFTFLNVGTNKCIDGFLGHGQDVVIWNCDGTSGQDWIVRRPNSANLHILQFENVFYPGQCLDVRGNSTANGAHIQLWDCTTGDNQRWT